MQNRDLRSYAKESGVFWWEIAEELKIYESAMSRELRHELPEPEKARIRNIIDTVKKRKAG